MEDVDDIFKETAVQKLFFVCTRGRDKRRSWFRMVVHRLRWNMLAWLRGFLRKNLEILKQEGLRI